MKHTLIPRILTLLTLGLMLLSSCATKGDTGITIPSSQTEQPSTTTAATTESYRPDLYWPSVTKYPIAGAWPAENPVLYNITTSETQLETPNFMVEIHATRYGDKTENIDITDYLISRGWEILPDDAYQYVKWGSQDMIYAVAPSWEELSAFSVPDMLDYYEMEQSVIDDGGLIVYITQCMLKSM